MTPEEKTLKAFEELIVQAKALGFDYVDLYIPDKKSEELIAFTFSKSKKYIDKIQEIEVEEAEK